MQVEIAAVVEFAQNTHRYVCPRVFPWNLTLTHTSKQIGSIRIRTSRPWMYWVRPPRPQHLLPNVIWTLAGELKGLWEHRSPIDTVRVTSHHVGAGHRDSREHLGPIPKDSWEQSDAWGLEKEEYKCPSLWGPTAGRQVTGHSSRHTRLGPFLLHIIFKSDFSMTSSHHHCAGKVPPPIPPSQCMGASNKLFNVAQPFYGSILHGEEFWSLER